MGPTGTHISTHPFGPKEERQGDLLFQLIVEACPDIIYLYDRMEERYLFVSRRSTAILGYTPGQIQQLGRGGIERLIHPDDVAHARAHYAQQEGLAAGEVSMTTYRVLDAAGDYRILRCRQMAFSRSQTGAVQCILGVATDITDEVRRKREVDALRTQILQIRDDERRRIALRMHDTVMQHLVGAALLLHGIEQKLPPANGASGPLGEVRASLSRALRDMLEPLTL